eukprot:g19322.t1
MNGETLTLCRRIEDYLVLVHGRLPSERGECNANLDTSSFKENGRVRLDPAGLQCSTLWEVLVEYESAEGEKYSLLHCRPETTHQMRVHLGHLGNPIVGDTLYGFPSPLLGSSRLFVHKVRIGFFSIRGRVQSLTVSLQETPELWQALEGLKKVGDAVGCGAPGLGCVTTKDCTGHIRQLQARRERRRELVERLQEKLKALNNELAARKEEADRCPGTKKSPHQVVQIQDDQHREQELELQAATVRRFMESTLQEKVKRDSTQNELGIRIYDEVELMVEKSADEQALESKYIDTVLVTYCDKNMTTKKLREDACLYWGLSEVEFILKTMSNAKVHDELAIQSCFRENEDAQFLLVQKTPKNATLMDKELLHIMPKAGRKARRVAKQSGKLGEAKGESAAGVGGELAEQMLLLPGLFRYMTQRDQNVKQHLERLKLRNLCIYLTVLIMTIVDIYLQLPPGATYSCREGVVQLMTEGWALWRLSDTVADQLLVKSSPLRTYNYPVGYLQVRLQEDSAYAVPVNVTCFATQYTALTAETSTNVEVEDYFTNRSGFDGRHINTQPWSFGEERSTSAAGEASIAGSFWDFDGSGYSIEYDLQFSPLETVRGAFLTDMEFLQNQNWLSPESRALHLSFLLYNSNYDRFISNRYSVEMTGFGVVRPLAQVTIFRPGIIEYNIGLQQLLTDVIRLFFVLLICPLQIYWDFMYERRVNGSGCKHFYSVQGLVDLALGVTFFVMFGLRYGNFNVLSIDYFVQHAQTPLDAGELAKQFKLHIAIDAVISGLLLYRFAFFMRVNRHFFLIWTTVQQAAIVAFRLLTIGLPVFDYDPNRGWQLSFNVCLYYFTRLVFVNCWIAVLIHEYQKEYDYVVWCLPWPFRNLYLNFLRPKIERPAKDSEPTSQSTVQVEETAESLKSPRSNSSRPSRGLGLERAGSHVNWSALLDNTNQPRHPIFSHGKEIKAALANDYCAELRYDVKNMYKTRGICQRIARNSLFENFTMVVIVTYAIYMSIDLDLNEGDIITNTPWIFIVCEQLFCLYFFLELCIRFCAFERKCNSLKDSWFVFDLVLVVLMVAETWVMNIVIAFMASGGAVENVFGDASFLRIFRLMRLTRLLRMARLIRMVPELLIMVKAVASAARSVGFTLILLGICLYVYAIVFRLLFDQTTAGNEYFPSVLMAMHKLFMHGTLLDSVSEMMTELLKESWIGFILGYFFIISSAITVMNMLIGVLCEVITAVADAEKEALQVSWTTEVLQQCLTAGADTNNDGCIDLDDVLREADVDAATLINFADVLFEGEGDELLTKIPFSEFMTRTLKLRGSNTATVKDLVDLRKWMSKELLALRKLSRMSMASMAMPTAMPYSVNLPFEYVLHV